MDRHVEAVDVAQGFSGRGLLGGEGVASHVKVRRNSGVEDPLRVEDRFLAEDRAVEDELDGCLRVEAVAGDGDGFAGADPEAVHRHVEDNVRSERFLDRQLLGSDLLAGDQESLELAVLQEEALDPVSGRQDGVEPVVVREVAVLAGRDFERQADLLAVG